MNADIFGPSIEHDDPKYIEYPELILNLPNLQPDYRLFKSLLYYIYKSRDLFLRISKNDYSKGEVVNKILNDQAVVFIRGMLELGLLQKNPVETGAFIHTLVIDWPKSLLTIHLDQPPYNIDLILPMVEYVPSMQMLLDKLDYKEDGATIFNITILACLACKYPNQKNFEMARLILSKHLLGVTSALDANQFRVLRLLIKTFPVLVESLQGSSCMRCIGDHEDVLSEDMKLIAEAVQKPIYRRSFSCII